MSLRRRSLAPFAMAALLFAGCEADNTELEELGIEVVDADIYHTCAGSFSCCYDTAGTVEITNTRSKPVSFTISMVPGIDFRANGYLVAGYTPIVILPGETVSLEVLFDCTFLSGILDTAELTFYEDCVKLGEGEICIDIDLGR